MKRTKRSQTDQNAVLIRRYRKARAFADLTLRSASGKSIFSTKEKISPRNVHEFYPPEGNAKIVRKIVEDMGLRVVSQDRITISVSAPLEDFQKIFGVKLTIKRYFPYAVPKKQRMPDKKGCGVELLCRGQKDLPVPPSLQAFVERILLPGRVVFCESATPPTPGYHHLKVPADVARHINAIACHHRGFNGTGIRLAMPDQGTYSHAYYTAQGYSITFDDSAYDGTADTKGHGTAIAANALAAAPAVSFFGVRNGSFLTSGIACFNRAVELNPHVITVSWGTGEENVGLRTAVSQAINGGITVCCACGNGGDVVFPSSMPEVVSVGGAFADANDQLQASSYASSGQIPASDPGRQMPDLVGLVGQGPKGVYITLPIESGFKEDDAFGGGQFPDSDETAKDDGWLVASGTSSATPQVAAAACLLMQKDPSFQGQPAVVKQRLMETAIDVNAGSSASGEAAAAGADNATGAGLVDAFVAINLVDLWVRCNELERGIVPKLSPIYVSPDIKVLSSPLGNPDAQFDAAAHIPMPTYGNTFYVYIKVHNRGILPASHVTVGFFYADPSTLISYPEDWNDGQTGNPALGTITVDGLATNLFIIDHIERRGSRVAGPFAWTPPDPTTATQVGTLPNGKKYGHFCLLTRTECAQDPIHWMGGDWNSLALDNNLGVRNLSVVQPDLVFPLTVKPALKARDCALIIDTHTLPKHLVAWFMVRESMQKRFTLVADATKQKLTVVRPKDQRGFVHVGVPSRVRLKVDLAGHEKVTIRSWITAEKAGQKPVPPKQTRGRVYLTQYADGVEVGGLAVEVR